MKEVGKAFTDQTGIPVVYDGRTDGVMSTLLQAARAQNRQPPVDVFYTFDIDAAQNTARGLFETISAADVPNLANMLPQAKPEGSGDGWPYVNVGADIVTLVYRTDKFPARPPTSLNILFDPAFKGRIFLYSVGTLTLELAAVVNGWSIPADMDKIWSFLSTKVKPQDPILGTDSDVIGGFQRNEIDLAMTYPTIAEELKGDGVRWTKAKEGLVGGNEVVAVPQRLPEANRYWAHRYIDILLSPEILSTYCNRLMIACFRKDLTVPADTAVSQVIPHTPEALKEIFTVPADAYIAHQSEWAARYAEILK